MKFVLLTFLILSAILNFVCIVKSAFSQKTPLFTLLYFLAQFIINVGAIAVSLNIL